VKQTYRKLGIAKALFQSFEESETSNAVYVTHPTRVLDEILQKKNAVVFFNPYLAMEARHES
jgi:hypothetical protein